MVEPTNSDFTLNPKFGETDAVTEPLAILDDWTTCSASADNGMLNKPAPLPLNIEADTSPLTIRLSLSLTEPVNSEPLTTEITWNPVFGVTDAVTDPLANKFDRSASGVNAALGISNKSLPEPENDADIDGSCVVFWKKPDAELNTKISPSAASTILTFESSPTVSDNFGLTKIVIILSITDVKTPIVVLSAGGDGLNVCKPPLISGLAYNIEPSTQYEPVSFNPAASNEPVLIFLT